MVPSFGQHAISLIELADEALYEAKRSGRNPVCGCNAIGGTGDGFAASARSEAAIGKTA